MAPPKRGRKPSAASASRSKRKEVERPRAEDATFVPDTSSYDESMPTSSKVIPTRSRARLQEERSPPLAEDLDSLLGMIPATQRQAPNTNYSQIASTQEHAPFDSFPSGPGPALRHSYTTGRPRTWYCNTCDEIRVLTDSKIVPHDYCDTLAEKHRNRKEVDSVRFYGNEIRLRDLSSLEQFQDSIERKDSLKNFFLDFLTVLNADDIYKARFFGPFLLLWRKNFCVIVYEMHPNTIGNENIQVNMMDDYATDFDMQRLNTFRRQSHLDKRLSLGFQREWLYTYYYPEEKDAWERAKQSPILGLLNVALNEEWAYLFEVFVLDPDCKTEMFHEAVTVLAQSILVELNNKFNVWKDVYACYKLLVVLITQPQINSSRIMNKITRRQCRA